MHSKKSTVRKLYKLVTLGGQFIFTRKRNIENTRFLLGHVKIYVEGEEIHCEDVFGKNEGIQKLCLENQEIAVN